MTGETGVGELARRWRIAIADTGFVPMSMRELEHLLLGLLQQLVTIVRAEPFDAAPAAAIGAALVRANLTDPQVMPRSARALTPLATTTFPPGDRVLAVLGEMARGYTEELLATRARHQEMLHSAMADARNAAEARFRVVFDNAAIAIGIGDAEGRVVDVNPAMAAMLGVSREYLLERGVTDLIHPDDRVELRRRVLGELLHAGSGTVRMELRYPRPEGVDGWATWAITLVPATGGRAAYLLVVGEDTTQRRELQAELHRQARLDPLTGLPNRRQLVEVLSAIITDAETEDCIGLCFIDLDGFKSVNDTYGHGVGDRLLVAVADRLSAAVPAILLARVGGDEFVGLVRPTCDTEHIATVAQRLLDALTEPIPVDNHDLMISACIGAIVTPVTGTDAERLLDAADAGLYRAKASGRNRWVLHATDVAARVRGLG
ncbi:diguanylate cyclase domain-containing protein [Nocardia nova]|jgi:diguanylate cyclase (GGDEF)-like protein/PAS domain S-box-containing protein|uniref:diguanylate cyclase domain-containing protein n=1 Tax=Nocardia nova TaxID=37330 RepID=UPI00189595DB|nr:diguanylate cyclase [Nocardia nova]MBF6149907.1 diguanylate cyclase [Nocardia nova]MDN2499097.1 diguanylate cyclase [Nocardia nova]